MAGDVTKGFLKRLSYIDGRPGDYDGGSLIAGQEYYDVYFTGGEIQNVTLTNPVFSSPLSLQNGGTGSVLSSPGDDRIMFWDQSAGQVDWLVPGSGLVVVDKTITVAGAGVGDVAGPGSSTDNAIARFNGLTGKVIQNSGASIDDSGNITAANLSGTNTGDQTITLSGAVTGSGTGAITTTFGDIAGLSVIGRSANTTGTPAAITAGSDFQVLRRSGTSVGFGSVNLASTNSVTGVLDEVNGGTGQSSITAGDILYGSASNTLSKLAIGTSGQVLTVSGGIPSWQTSAVPSAATQGEQETGTSTTVYVSPGTQHYHPSASKCWGLVTVSGGTPTLTTGYNVTSITDVDVGRLTVTINNDFSSANYAVLATVERESTGAAGADTRLVNLRNSTRAAGSFTLDCYSADSFTYRDPSSWSFDCKGDI